MALYQRLDDTNLLMSAIQVKYHLSYTMSFLPGKSTINVSLGANQPESSKPFTINRVLAVDAAGGMGLILAGIRLGQCSAAGAPDVNGRFKVLL